MDVVVDSGVDGGLLLETSHPPEPQHRPFASSEWRVRILGPDFPPDRDVAVVEDGQEYEGIVMTIGEVVSKIAPRIRNILISKRTTPIPGSPVSRMPSTMIFGRPERVTEYVKIEDPITMRSIIEVLDAVSRSAVRNPCAFRRHRSSAIRKAAKAPTAGDSFTENRPA